MKRILFALLTLAMAGQTSAALKAPKQSWGRTGITFETYRRDAVECGRQGYYLDISRTEDAKAFVRGSRELDSATQDAFAVSPGADPVDAATTKANEYERIRIGVQPERRMDHLKSVMQSTVDRCLQLRGYRQFRLTESQRRQLGKLPLGSTQRQSFLFALASDSAVLSAQAL